MSKTDKKVSMIGFLLFLAAMILSGLTSCKVPSNINKVNSITRIKVMEITIDSTGIEETLNR